MRLIHGDTVIDTVNDAYHHCDVLFSIPANSILKGLYVNFHNLVISFSLGLTRNLNSFLNSGRNLAQKTLDIADLIYIQNLKKKSDSSGS